jgi:hypothetical protein
MATLANVFGRFLSRAAEQERAASRPLDAGTRLRAFANEDIYLFVKHIDNSRVVRAADPESGRRAWKQIGTMAAAVAVIVAVLMPSAYGTLAGYQIERLRQEGEKLAAQRAQLELREAALLSPERMLELARQQEFIDPAPEQVVHLDKAGEQEFATVAVPAERAPGGEVAAQAK